MPPNILFVSIILDAHRRCQEGLQNTLSETLFLYKFNDALIRSKCEFRTGNALHNILKKSKSEVKGVAIVEGRETAGKEATNRTGLLLRD
jgi:hypothetical protein